MTAAKQITSDRKSSKIKIEKIKERIFLVPTFQGLILAAGCLAFFTQSILYGHDISYGLAVTLITLTLVSGVLGNNNLKQLSIQSCKIIPGPENSDLRCSIRFSSCGKEAHLALKISLTESSKKGWRQKKLATIRLPEVVIGENRAISIYMRATQRGIYSIPRVRVESRFPLGLFVAWRTYSNLGEYFIYPQPNITHCYNHKEGQNHYGDTTNPFGNDGDFSDFRRLREGESMNRVDWKVLARTDRYVVREFLDGSNNRKLISWFDCNQENDEDKLRQLSGQLFDCSRKGDVFALALPGEQTSWGTSQEHLYLCLRKLAEFLCK